MSRSSTCRYCGQWAPSPRAGTRRGNPAFGVCDKIQCRAWARRAERFNATHCYSPKRWMEYVEPYEVFSRANWICHICEQAIDPNLRATDPEGGTIDHIIPFYRGGKTAYANCAAAHRKCNTKKSFFTTEQARARRPDLR